MRVEGGARLGVRDHTLLRRCRGSGERQGGTAFAFGWGMRRQASFFCFIICGGCDSLGVVSLDAAKSVDLAFAVDGSASDGTPADQAGDLAGVPGDGGADLMPLPAAPPKTLARVVVLGGGADFNDVSTDQGQGIWGVTDGKVYYWKGGGGRERTFDQSSGLARGRYTWVDPYWFGSEQAPSTQDVRFSAVAGGMPGQAFIGNIGYLGDRLQIDPDSGAVVSLEGLTVTSLQQPNADELAAQKLREVATWRAAVDLNGTYSGAAYFGGFHGTSGLYHMTLGHASGDCGCGDFEEHIHPFTDESALGGDVHAITMTDLGDVWIGDRKAIYFLPQGSLGPTTDLFLDINGKETEIPGQPQLSYLVPFPNAKNGDNWIYGIAVDASGGLYVASRGNGLVYLERGTYAPTFYSQADGLPSDDLTGVDIDKNGDVWIATASDGVVRYSPARRTFTHYTDAEGLPSNFIRQVYVDKYGANPRGVYFATRNGVAVYTGP